METNSVQQRTDAFLGLNNQNNNNDCDSDNDPNKNKKNALIQEI